ncbi:ribosome small subunit-dependent GTPase [Erysipelothrix larvae]|uniref:Small ribosomal subunit biogenesis GTPase RsgA n=1 Tax=Erysipelothrix larvae TaxID=1514105 RepID=A0A109UH08_9FIRM|nr:ribosome small subunit-dependent GTPase A [Erysipelothrix larvae]AMC93436.1 ribosome small subunit-dependent GTPase [Erysipelothrix larvae]
MEKARIVKIVSNRYTVELNGSMFVAVAMGKLRLREKPVVGDFVEIEMLDEKWVIQKVLPRRNALIRPLVANVDQALIVMSAKNPDFSYTLVDRLLFLVCTEAIDPVIIITKKDLIDEQTLATIIDEYKSSGYDIYAVSKYDDQLGIESVFKDKISVLAGQSGVGKSSILNKLDASLSIDTQEISKALGRGKHTTRHNQLFEILGGWIADTPGFSSLDFAHVDALYLAQNIKDFKPYFESCRFRNCMHVNEPGCAVKTHVETGDISKIRYKNYCECLALIEEDSR